MPWTEVPRNRRGSLHGIDDQALLGGGAASEVAAAMERLAQAEGRDLASESRGHAESADSADP
jgi:hypothetical protein